MLSEVLLQILGAEAQLLQQGELVDRLELLVSGDVHVLHVVDEGDVDLAVALAFSENEWQTKFEWRIAIFLHLTRALLIMLSELVEADFFVGQL